MNIYISDCTTDREMLKTNYILHLSRLSGELMGVLQ